MTLISTRNPFMRNPPDAHGTIAGKERVDFLVGEKPTDRSEQLKQVLGFVWTGAAACSSSQPSAFLSSSSMFLAPAVPQSGAR
jgi:hypothetical protein